MTPQQLRIRQRTTADESKTTVGKLFVMFGGGALALSEFIDLSAIAVARANIITTSLADVFMTGLLGLQPFGLGRPERDLSRIEAALGTIVKDTDEPLFRIERLAYGEPLSASQSASREVLIQTGVAEYVLDTDDDPCPLCKELANQTFPIDHASIIHPGCACVLLPVAED